MEAEQKAPSRKNSERPMRTPASPGRRNSRPNTTAANTIRVRNWRFRYAAAPSWIALAISLILEVPSRALSTCCRNVHDNNKAAAATTPMTTTMTTLD